MKIKSTLLAIALATASASATTVTAGGGTSGAIFVTSTGVTLTAADTSFRVGLWDGNLFTAFAVADATPMDISTVAALLGRWTGNFADTSATATPFNGQNIWFEVTTTSQGGGKAYFSGVNGAPTNFPAAGASTLFPNNGGGVGDSISYDSRNLTVLGAGSSVGSRAYSADAQGIIPANSIVIGVVPEPSAALLGAIGALGLLRRRRI